MVILLKQICFLFGAVWKCFLPAVFKPFYVFLCVELIKGIEYKRLKKALFKYVGLSNILYSERFKESSKFFFRREPSKRAHR